MIAGAIRDELSLILPEQADLFSENTEAFKTELETIYTTFIEGNTNKTAKEFVVFHDAYNYLMESI
jgi:ABC-type Zn2+ transport system substrate-binding protein/surface adhesin